MKISLMPMISLLIITRIAEDCSSGAEYIYSANLIEIKRCADVMFFYYTDKYENETVCVQSDSLNPGVCWWDTTFESHCLDSEECIWIEDDIPGGACYCGVSTDCDECDDKTPGPTASGDIFQCPENCKVYHTGCPGAEYCNCVGGCVWPLEGGCADPVNPGCLTYYTPPPSGLPTSSPTPAKAVYWGCRMCCVAENLLSSTTSAVAQTLGLFNHQVKIASYSLFGGRRRLSESGSEWDIVYEIGLDESDSTETVKSKLEDTEILNTVVEAISTELGFDLNNLETTSLSENQPTYTPTAVEGAKKSDSMGTMIGAIIGALVGVLILIFACYKLYIWRKLDKFQPNEDQMTKEGLHPVSSDDLAYI